MKYLIIKSIWLKNNMNSIKYLHLSQFNMDIIVICFIKILIKFKLY
jgi:hypothetical protein